MDDRLLLRYSRQIMLPVFGIEAQQRLLDARVLIVGAGGLGSPAAMYLAAAGVGAMTLIDPDGVDLSNLQRQLLHRESDIGSAKVSSARNTLLGINSGLELETHVSRVEDLALADLLENVDAVLDCSDNFSTRFHINRACVRQRVPLISGAAIRFEGQLGVYDARKPESPCFQCLYREGQQAEETCADNGILAPVVGTIGTLQALEAIKVLCKLGEDLCGRLLLFDGMHQEWRTVRLKKDPACPVCSV